MVTDLSITRGFDRTMETNMQMEKRMQYQPNSNEKINKKLKLEWKQIKYCTEKTAEAKLLAAKRKYYSKKKYFAEWRKEFQYLFIDALAKTEHLPRKTIEKRMKREDQQEINGIKAKNITEKKRRIRYFVQ